MNRFACNPLNARYYSIPLTYAGKKYTSPSPSNQQSLDTHFFIRHQETKKTLDTHLFKYIFWLIP